MVPCARPLMYGAACGLGFHIGSKFRYKSSIVRQRLCGSPPGSRATIADGPTSTEWTRRGYLIADLISKCQRVWELHFNEVRGGRWNDDKWREPFELLGAALRYTYNALKQVSEPMHHEKLRAIIQDRQAEWRQPGPIPTDFSIHSPDHIAGTMHLASSSFRLTTVLYLISKGLVMNSQEGELTGLLTRKNNNPHDWCRKALKGITPPQSCCQNNPGPVKGKKEELVILLDHRDEFGHGERGNGEPGEKRIERQKNLYFCQVMHAQLSLAQYGLHGLTKLPSPPP